MLFMARFVQINGGCSAKVQGDRKALPLKAQGNV